MEWVALLAGLVIVFLITIATGYFVAQEFAYMAVDRAGLAARAAKGDASAERALAITRRTSFLLSGAQLGITVTGLLVGYVAEPLIGQSLGDLLGGVGIPAAVSIGIGGLVALAFSTVVQMLFGELFPKNLAIAEPEPMALRLAPSTRWYLTVFGWLIRFFDASANILLRILRIEPVHDVEHAASAKDLEEIVAESRESGDLDPELSMMLDRILDFPSHDVAHAMVPRTQVDTLSDTDTVAELRQRMADDGHSRYPVLTEETDEVIGVVHLSDLLQRDYPGDMPVGALARPALLLPDLMPLMTAVEELMTARSHMALRPSRLRPGNRSLVPIRTPSSSRCAKSSGVRSCRAGTSSSTCSAAMAASWLTGPRRSNRTIPASATNWKETWVPGRCEGAGAPGRAPATISAPCAR